MPNKWYQELWFGGCKFLVCFVVADLSDLPHQKRILSCSVGELFMVACVGYCCVAAMVSFSSAVKFDIEKFDGRMVRTAKEEDELLTGPQLHMGIGWRLMQVV
ncbi:hypothetical protein PIB30_031217 [Stylosanthes scabra]|uniref:Uncharacterized protein n=1 Tax=Stylosanthes scabra TaxID=79078 RepID=A0ABU6TBG9_9FABA|nr:hypothetical protein [Stylosanthes scabra]